jgi:hypothetical protein
VVDKVLVALHVLVTLQADEAAAREIGALSQRASAAPYSAAVLVELHDWLQRNADRLIGQVRQSLGTTPHVTGVRLVLRALSTIATYAAADDIARDLKALSERFEEAAKSDERRALACAREWIERKVDVLVPLLRTLIRPLDPGSIEGSTS